VEQGTYELIVGNVAVTLILVAQILTLQRSHDPLFA
jgi:hypothetical protein